MAEVNTVDISDSAGTVRTVATASLLARTEDLAAEADPRGTPLMGIRRDTLTSAEVSADGDYIAVKADSRGALHVAVAPTALSIAKTEDAAHSDGDVGVMILTKRTDTAASSAGTDGDYATLNTDSAGRLHASIAGNLYTEDAAAAGDPVGPALIAVRRDTLSSSEVSADGDNIALKADSRGALHVTMSATALSPAKLEDAAHSSGDAGIPMWSVRADTAASSAGTDGDYAAINTDSTGRLRVNIESSASSIAKAEDAAHTTGDAGVAIWSVRADSAASSAGTDGDYAAINTDSTGRLRVNLHSSATSIAKDEDAASSSSDTGAFVLAIQKAAPTNLAGTDADYAGLQMSDGRLWVSGGINIVQAASATIARPGDTTSYTSGDLIANSVTAGSVNALQFTTMARVSGGGGEITGVTIQKSTNVVTNVAIRVHLFTTIPTFTSAGDNSALSTVVVASAKGYLGYVDVSTFVGFSDVAWGSGAPDNSRGSIAFAATAQIIYGICEARGAFAPGNAEVFTISLAARQN